jgi:hypothetical protein
MRTYIVDGLNRNFRIDTAGMRYIEQDKDATLDYTFDWQTKYLMDAEDVLASASVTCDLPDATLSSSVTNGGKVTFWLSNITPGLSYLITNRIHTLGGRIDERSIKIKCTDL